MTGIFAELGAWNWLILAGLLMALELMAPGIFLIWLGIAAALVGVLAFIIDMSWAWELAIFAALSLVSVFLAHRYLRAGRDTPTDRPFLNRRAHQHVGKSYVLAEAIENGRGKIKIGDSLWRVEGPDASEGARVRVTDADGTVLKVELAE